jgi:hypothetical protein
MAAEVRVDIHHFAPRCLAETERGNTGRFRPKRTTMSLREGFEQIDLLDRSNLNSLKNRGQMLIGRVFGGNGLNKYQLSKMEFRSTFEHSIDSWSGAIVARRWWTVSCGTSQCGSGKP